MAGSSCVRQLQHLSVSLQRAAVQDVTACLEGVLTYRASEALALQELQS